MNCPRCGITSPDATAACASCGFSLGGIDCRLGSHSVIINRLVDTQHLLRLRDTGRLESLLDEFERRFPQAFFTVFLGVLPRGVTTSEGGFWLLNHGVRTCQGIVRSNQYGLALVIDPSTHEASLSLGYEIEALISTVQARELLRKASAALWHGDHSRAVTLVVKGVDKLLRKGAKSRRRPPPIDSPKPRKLFGFEKIQSPESLTETHK